jgi:hypothetical protein
MATTEERIAVENVIRPGRPRLVDARMYGAMRRALSKALPAKAPGLRREPKLLVAATTTATELFADRRGAGFVDTGPAGTRRHALAGGVEIACVPMTKTLRA